MPPTTITYSTIKNVPIQLDLYLPETLPREGKLSPMIFFHLGGLTSGSRKDEFFPEFLKDLVVKRGFPFISADYRLLPTSTAYDIIQDVKNLFAFLSPSGGGIAPYLPKGVSLDLDKSGVIGISAGTYIARLCAMHITPRPKALLLGYGVGGDLISKQLLDPKQATLWKPLSQEMFQRSFDNVEHDKSLRVELPVDIDPSADIMPLSDRLMGCLLYMAWNQEGVYLDYLTGQHGLSERLRQLPPEHWNQAVIDAGHKDLFPELCPQSLPPTFLFHGDQDTATALADSKRTFEQLVNIGTKTEFVIVEDADHVLWYPGKGPMGGIKPESDEVYTKGFEFLVDNINAV